MIIPDYNKALHVITELNMEMRSWRNDGWTTSSMKEKLWEIKTAVDRALKDAPTFVGEPDYEDEYLLSRIRNEI